MILDAIKKSADKAIQRGWDTEYYGIDIHDTIFKGNYKTNDIPTDFYPYAKETLQLLSLHKGIKLMLYTCSHPKEIDLYLEFFEKNQIHFDFVNENTDVLTDLEGYGNYDKKPYFTVLMDDKAGFNPHEDWKLIYDYFKSLETSDNNNKFISPDIKLPRLNKMVKVLLSNGEETIGYHYHNPNRYGWMTLCKSGLLANQIWSGISVVGWKEDKDL